jgi:hypothetical protein
MLHHRCPDSMKYIWDWFLELCRGRPSSGSGLAPIPSTEIAAWASLSRVELSVWELGVLRKLDMAFIKGGSEPNG